MTTDREQLEAERDFLLKSLDDLETERESGAIDEASYSELHDDYTARAAATIRALRDGVDARPRPAPPLPRKRRLAIVAAIVAFALVAGGVLAAALGARLPGQTSSGNSQSSQDATAARLGRLITSLEGKVNTNPNDYDNRLALAHAYEANGDFRNALAQSDAAIQIDASRPQAHANAGRLLFIVSRDVKDKTTKNQFVTEADAAFTTALEKDPGYTEANYFRAVLEAAIHDYARAQADAQIYLAKTPTGPYVNGARSLLTQVTKALESTSTTVPSSP